MPYKKSYRKHAKAKSSYAMAKKALKKVNNLSKRSETKHYDLDFLGPFQLDYLGTVISLNVGIVQGIADTERIGDSIFCLGNRTKFILDINTIDRSMCRFILMWDKEDSITIADNFLATTGDANVINSPYLVDERHKYIVLMDKIVSLNQGSTRIRQVNMSRKLNKKTQFEGGTTNVTKGRLKLWLFSDQDSLTVGRPKIEGWSRLWYKDS